MNGAVEKSIYYPSSPERVAAELRSGKMPGAFTRRMRTLNVLSGATLLKIDTSLIEPFHVMDIHHALDAGVNADTISDQFSSSALTQAVYTGNIRPLWNEAQGLPMLEKAFHQGWIQLFINKPFDPICVMLALRSKLLLEVCDELGHSYDLQRSLGYGFIDFSGEEDWEAGDPNDCLPPGIDNPIDIPQPGDPGYIAPEPQPGDPDYVPPGIQPGEPGYIPPGPGEPGYIAPLPGEPGYIPPGPGPGEPGYIAPLPGEPGYVAPLPGEPGYIAPLPGEPGYIPPGPGPGEPGYIAPAPLPGEPGYIPPQPGDPGYIPPGPGEPGYFPPCPLPGEPGHGDPMPGEPGYSLSGEANALYAALVQTLPRFGFPPGQGYYEHDHGMIAWPGSVFAGDTGGKSASKKNPGAAGPNCCLHSDGLGGYVKIGYTTRQMSVDEEQVLTVDGYVEGCAAQNFVWAIASGGGELSADHGWSVTYTAPATNADCENNPTITLTCSGEVVDTLTIAVNGAAENVTAYYSCEEYYLADTSVPCWYGAGATKVLCHMNFSCIGVALGAGGNNDPCCVDAYGHDAPISWATSPAGCSSLGYDVGITDGRDALLKSQGCCPEALL